MLPLQQAVLGWKLVELLALDKKSRVLLVEEKALQQELEKPQVSIHWVYLSASLAEVWEHPWWLNTVKYWQQRNCLTIIQVLLFHRLFYLISLFCTLKFLLSNQTLSRRLLLHDINFVLPLWYLFSKSTLTSVDKGPEYAVTENICLRAV